MEPAEDSAGSVETKKGISTANPSYVSGGYPPCLCIYYTMSLIYYNFLPNLFIFYLFPHINNVLNNKSTIQKERN